MGKMNLRKIVLIGPVYPYSSGISHYTSLLCSNLSKTYDVTMVSFSFQYPQFLYRKKQKDYSNDSFRINGTKYWINTLNPFNWLKVAKNINELDPDLVIMEWWHPYFTFCFRTLAKSVRAKIIFICHNVLPHEHVPLDKTWAGLTLKHADAFIVQSGLDEKDLKCLLPDAVYKKTVHPTYDAFRMKNTSKAAARAQLSIKEDEQVLLFFGFVRKYKGLKYLIQAMPAIKKSLPKSRLLIVGDFGDSKPEYLELIAQAGVDDVISIYDGYIPDKEVEQYFAASDVVVAPYVSATQSGIIQIAYGFEKPVIATAVGGLPDVVNDSVTGYLVESENPSALSDAVIRFFNDTDIAAMEQGVRDAAYLFSWDRMNETIQELYDQLNDQ